MEYPVIIVEKQGGVIACYDPDYTHPHAPQTPQRGIITEMSRKSRRGLLVLLNRLEYTGDTSFLTLTFHGVPTLSQSNAAFKRFRAWFMKRLPNASAVWRREKQPGRGSFHFHLLVFNVPYIPQAELQDIWTRCTQEDRSIVHVRRVHNRKHALAYVSKYIAKVPPAEKVTSLELSPYLQQPEKPSVGRAWGWINADALPFAEAERIVIDDDNVGASIWLAVSVLSWARCGNDPHLLIFFTDDGDFWMKRIQELAVWSRNLSPLDGKICYNEQTVHLAA